jgi:RimJ/RimL family protein N-acetyltransferase
VVLRRLCGADADSMTAVFGDSDVMRFGDGPQSADSIRRWIKWAIQQYDDLGFGPWAIAPRESETLIGYCGLFQFDDINGRPEIELGYRLAKKYWGRGLATEAATAARDVALSQFGIKRLISLIDPDNSRSIRVAAKLGMRYADDVMLPGYSYPDRVYSYTDDVG